MKTLKTILLIAIFTMLSIPKIYAQTYEYEKPISSSEIYKGTITRTFDGGSECYLRGTTVYIDLHNYTNPELYDKLLKEAKKEYSGSVILRQFKVNKNKETKRGGYDNEEITYKYNYIVSATVCAPAPPKIEATPAPTATYTTTASSKQKADPLKQAITKALINIREGSRLALDQIRTVNGDKEDFKDQIVEILLDEGFKVVAKEYLDRLYEEQQAQQSGIYNDRTIVQENNFSAVGYYINVKRTDSSIKVQIINVSTGEYEANVTVNL